MRCINEYWIYGQVTDLLIFEPTVIHRHRLTQLVKIFLFDGGCKSNVNIGGIIEFFLCGLTLMSDIDLWIIKSSLLYFRFIKSTVETAKVKLFIFTWIKTAPCAFFHNFNCHMVSCEKFIVTLTRGFDITCSSQLHCY